MTDENKNEPVSIKTQGDVVAAARKGMRLPAIAARAGYTPVELKALLDGNRDFKIAYELAIAEYEEEARGDIEDIKSRALAKEDLSLCYKIAKEKIKELRDADNAGRVMQVVVSPDSGLFEPEYEELSEEELEAIRAKTESEANRD